MNSYLLIAVMIFIGAGCSFKNPDTDQKQTNPLSSELYTDSDGDGVSDQEERKSGSNPFVAEVPTFSGEFFTEMKIRTTFYNLARHSEEYASFQVRKGGVSENGVPAEERDFLSKNSEFLIEQNALLAKKSAFSGFHHMRPIGPEHIGYFSPPRMNDLKIFPYSSRVAALSKTHAFEEIEFSITNRLNISFPRSQTYTDIAVNLYWFDELRGEFILIGSDFLKGVYEFNQSYQVPLQFKTNDKALVKTISINGARFLYLKIMDFKVLELNRFYKQILSEVQKKSIPVLVSDSGKSSLKYVGVNGGPTGLKTILNRALSDQVQIVQDRIVRIGSRNEGATILRDPYGGEGISNNKWFLLTSEINNNPLTYSFSPKDVVILSYLSSSAPFGLIPSYFANTASTESYEDLATIKIMKENFLDLRLNLRPSTVRVPVNSVTQKFECKESPNSKACFEFTHEVKTINGIQALQISSIIYISINNTSFRLDKLIENKDASFRVKNSEVIEIKFNESLFRKIPESNGLTLTFSTRPTSLAGCTGVKVCESTNDICAKYASSPPLCEEADSGTNYILKDMTKKTFYPVRGEMFFSVEYI